MIIVAFEGHYTFKLPRNLIFNALSCWLDHHVNAFVHGLNCPVNNVWRIVQQGRFNPCTKLRISCFRDSFVSYISSVLHQLPCTIVSYISSYKKRCTLKYKLYHMVITCVSLPLNTEQCLYKNTIKSVFVPIIVFHVMPPSWLPLSQNNRTSCWYR
jgi:hypothetical protein